MSLEKGLRSAVTERGLRIALVFALVAERLSAHYEYGQWLTVAQGATLVADWLGRSKRSLPLGERQHLSTVSDQLARQVAASVSREVGLHITHEMMEALDPNHQSDVGQTMMQECERMLDAADA